MNTSAPSADNFANNMPPDPWWDSPLGRYIVDWETEQCDRIVADLFGYFAMQLGFPKRDFLRANRMQTRMTCDWNNVAHLDAAVYSHPEQLSFASSSLDLVVMPHILEFSRFPHEILREAERVLIPQGSLLIIGFNPYSSWGCRNRYGRSEVWKKGRYLSIPRIRDWLRLLGFDVRRGLFGRYAPPINQTSWLQRFRFLEWAGDRWWPFAGSVYLLLAVKRVPGVRLILPRHAKKQKVKNLVPLTHMSGKGDE